MSEPFTPPPGGSQSSPATGAPPAGSPQSQGAVSETKQAVSLEQLAEEQQKVDERLRGISTILNRLVKEKESVQQAKQPEPAKRPDAATGDSLTGQVQELARWKSSLEERERRSQLRSAAEANGVTGIGQDYLVDVVFAKRSADIIVTGDQKVIVRDGDREVTPQEFVKAFLATDQGKFFLPARRNPGAPPDSSDTGAATSAPRFNWDGMSYADAMKARDTGGYDEWWKWHQANPGAWDRKRAGGK